MRPLLCAAFAALAAVLLGPLTARGGAAPPAPTRYVTDGSGVLPPERAEALERKLADFERRTSTQVLVWIAPRVPEGTTAEELGADAIRAWGVGQRGRDNGAVLFLFTEDRAMRLATGYGLEGAIPDVRAKQILRDLVKPHLQRGDVAAGVEAGVDAILALARGEPFEGSGRTVAEEEAAAKWGWLLLPWAIVAAILAFVYFRGTPRPAAISLLLATLGVILWMFEAVPAAVGLAFVALGAGAIAIGVVLSRRGGDGWSSSSSSSSSDWSGSSSDGFSSSSSSSSDTGFSGGGGDSGGGGASETY